MQPKYISLDKYSTGIQQDIKDKNMYNMMLKIFDDMYHRIDHYNNMTRNIFN